MGPKDIPAKFSFLLNDPQPPLMVQAAMSYYGLHEGLDRSDNPVIIAWADEVAMAMKGSKYYNYGRWAAEFYNKDSIAWCGLFQAICAVRSAQGKPERLPPNNYLGAINWSNWGQPVAKLESAQMGDLAVLLRKGGAHVTQIVAFGKGFKSFFGLGGNQNDQVSIEEIEASRIHAIRRPNYNVTPPGARQIVMNSTGKFSTQEA